MIRPLFALALLVSSLAYAAEPAALNTLTQEEKAAGWKLLFDGTTTKGWVSLGKKTFPSSGWSVKDGTLFLAKGPGGGDIVTEEQFSDFELKWEWRVAEGGNGGLKYNLPDATKGVGCEYQLLDDLKHPDGVQHGPIRQTASLYDVLPPSAEKQLNPPGEWNESRIVVQGNQVEHWLNGKQVLAYELGSDALKAQIAKSKFKGMKEFGVKTKSPILLQDHNDEFAFRNIKIRPMAQ